MANLANDQVAPDGDLSGAGVAVDERLRLRAQAEAAAIPAQPRVGRALGHFDPDEGPDLLLHKALLSVVLHGGGLQEIVWTLADLVGAAALVTTTDGRVLVASEVPAVGRVQDDELFADCGRFRTERFGAGVHEVGTDQLTVVPVIAGEASLGHLVVISPQGSVSLHPRGRLLPLLELAATVTALVITKTRAVEMVEAKYRGDFVREVLLGRAGAAEHVASHFESLGWSVREPLVVVVASLDPLTPPTDHDAERSTQARFANAWQTVVASHDPRTPVAGFAQEVVALVPVTARDPREVVTCLVRDLTGDGGGGRRTSATGVSRIIEEPAAIPAGYEQARRAVQVGRQLQGTGSVAHFDDLGAFRLLCLIDDEAELRNFVAEVLGELADEADPEAHDLRVTLRALLDTNLNVAETSRRLHFHYNTLRYRIAKLERIVGPFTSDSDLRLDLALALRMLQIRGL